MLQIFAILEHIYEMVLLVVVEGRTKPSKYAVTIALMNAFRGFDDKSWMYACSIKDAIASDC